MSQAVHSNLLVASLDMSYASTRSQTLNEIKNLKAYSLSIKEEKPQAQVAT